MQSAYAIVTAVIFALVALGHALRLLNKWGVQIGPFSVSMAVSWVAVIVAALISIWGFIAL